MYDSVWFKEILWYSGSGSDCCMAFLKKGKDRMVVFDFVSAWVSVGGKPGNSEFVCMDASLDVGGVPYSRVTEDIDHRIEGDDDKFACISNVCTANSEVLHGMDLSGDASNLKKCSGIFSH